LTVGELDAFNDGRDFIIWNEHRFTQTAAHCSGDANADGFVDAQDFIIWNQTAFIPSVPEPASVLWLIWILAGAACLSRRSDS
jgi:hypothetical protein